MENLRGLILLICLIATNLSFAQEIEVLAQLGTRAEIEALSDGSELPFWDIPLLEKPFFDVSPSDRMDGVLVAELGLDGGNKAMLLKLAHEIANKEHGDYDCMLISYQGKLLFESYFLRGRINLPHPQASATKAYTSLLLGRVIQLGYLTMADLNKPVISFLKDLDPSKFTEGAEKITMHKALTMSGGLYISEEEKEEIKKTPKLLEGQGQIQMLLEHSAPISEESQDFLYGNYNPSFVMQVIDAVVPGNAKDFIKSEFLDKMGIEDYGWGTSISGLPEDGWRVSISSRDMLKLGILVMNKGQWNGEQLIPEAFIAKASSRILYTGDDDIFGGGKDVSNQGYGYFWWNADLKYGNKSYYCVNAQGGGGQYIILIEELDLVIVFTAHDHEMKALQMTAERIIPAFIDE